ncbi:MAG TPA: hypothetical protein PLU71_03035 [Candidatus Dependentiae bacterium]|nr:hypothetical protein [Candidatus Dependentiae bacterium]HRQ62806.1 hypothetical protein [Candidatus Dependentiae bacterium]
MHIALLFLYVFYAPALLAVHVSKQDALQIGKRIWHNECNGSIDGLTFWNKAEEFPSMGIGHFIWFPKNCTSPYTQTFPDLISFFKKNNITLPAWLATAKHCPWSSRQEFLAALDHPDLCELRTLLANTVDIQAQFIIQRLEQSLPILLQATPKNKRAAIKKQFNRVAQSSNGLYALIDYINFKGDGTNKKERYKEQGWGLLQVLEHMNTQTQNIDPLIAFQNAARTLLTQRVHNGPQHEKQFLQGWLNRINTYTKQTT